MPIILCVSEMLWRRPFLSKTLPSTCLVTLPTRSWWWASFNCGARNDETSCFFFIRLGKARSSNFISLFTSQCTFFFSFKEATWWWILRFCMRRAVFNTRNLHFTLRSRHKWWNYTKSKRRWINWKLILFSFKQVCTKIYQELLSRVICEKIEEILIEKYQIVSYQRMTIKVL